MKVIISKIEHPLIASEPKVMSRQNALSASYYGKAKLFFTYIFFLYIFFLLLDKLLPKISTDMLTNALVIAFNVAVVFIFTMLGTYNIIKSYTVKETFHQYKVLYLWGYIASWVAVLYLGQASCYILIFLLG